MKIRLPLMLTMLSFFVLCPLKGYAKDGTPQTKLNRAVQDRQASIELTTGASTDWWASVQKDIRKSEYNVALQQPTKASDIEGSYQAPNRAHNLRTYFTPEGIRVMPRTYMGPV